MGEKRYNVIAFGFTIGLFQDLIGQSDLLGIFALSKTVAAYFLCHLSKYNRVWKYGIKFLYLFLIFNFHYILVAYLMFDRSATPLFHVMKVSFIQSIFMLAMIIIVNKFILVDKKIIE